MGQSAQAQLPLDLAGHKGGIHPGPGDGTIGNGQQVGPRRLQALCPVHVARQVGHLRGIQLNGDHLFPGVQFAEERVVFFHRRSLRGGKRSCRGADLFHRQGIQLGPQGCDMGGRGAAAAAQDADPLGSQTAQLLCKILRLALILDMGAGNDGIPCIGHHRQRQARCAQLAHQRPHGPRGRHAVEAHGVHKAAFRHPAHQILAVEALAGVAVRQHRKRDEHKGVRHIGLEGFDGFQNACVGAQRLKQEVFCPLRSKALCHGGIDRPCRDGLGIGCRAQVRKDGRAHVCRGFCRQLPARSGQRFPAGLLCRCHPGQAKGVGLEGVGPGGQVRPVDRLHPRRVGEVGLLALGTGGGFIIGAHAAVKQQQLPGKMGSDVDHSVLLCDLLSHPSV